MKSSWEDGYWVWGSLANVGPERVDLSPFGWAIRAMSEVPSQREVSNIQDMEILLELCPLFTVSELASAEFRRLQAD